MDFIDLRSDTVTWPTDAMRKAMAVAAVGDDVYGDDPTMNELESEAARMTGKEAAVFVPSGTFGNQLALFSWCERGTEVIVDDQAHIVAHEAGAASVIAGVQLRTLDTRNGIMDPGAIAARIRRGDDIHFPKTSLICLENAHGNGRALPLDYMDTVAAVARESSIPVHLDGARLFNAATALKVEAAEIASRADSVMFCLSKGLCAPVGSMLAGSRAFVETARRKRKLMGGGMRQAGILAAAGLISLREMTRRLAEDHKRAEKLADALGSIPGVTVMTDNRDINMVFFRVHPEPDPEKTAQRLAERRILVNKGEGGIYRLVTHYWIKDSDIPVIAQAFREACGK